MSTSDRTVHARVGECEYVRYNQAGKWWIEYLPPRMRTAHQASLDEIVEDAVFNDANFYFGLPGGKQFDARVRKLLGEVEAIESAAQTGTDEQ